MIVDTDSICDVIEEHGFSVDRGSVEELDEQGVVNRVFTVGTDRGPVIIHVGKRLGEDSHSVSKQRIHGVLQFLQDQNLPCPEPVCYGTTSNNRSFVVQEKVDGRPLDTVDDQKQYFDEVAEILARLHEIEIDGYGLFRYENGELDAPHATWQTFLEQRRTDSLQAIRGVVADDRLDSLDRRLDTFFAGYSEVFAEAEPRFCHGDVGFGNILVDDSNVKALIDFEWAFAGDPAMEFIHDEARQLLPHYFDCRDDVNPDDFRTRIRLYNVITALGIAEIFQDDTEVVEEQVGEAEQILAELGL